MHRIECELEFLGGADSDDIIAHATIGTQVNVGIASQRATIVVDDRAVAAIRVGFVRRTDDDIGVIRTQRTGVGDRIRIIDAECNRCTDNILSQEIVITVGVLLSGARRPAIAVVSKGVVAQACVIIAFVGLPGVQRKQGEVVGLVRIIHCEIVAEDCHTVEV